MAIFEFNKRIVRKTLSRDPQEPGPVGRHQALAAEIEFSLITMVLNTFHS
jgi:hypothetical protein